MPPHRNGPVSYNVRPHTFTAVHTCAFQCNSIPNVTIGALRQRLQRWVQMRVASPVARSRLQRHAAKFRPQRFWSAPARFGQGCALGQVSQACQWLALRAGVLRRAVSLSVRPVAASLHSNGCHGPHQASISASRYSVQLLRVRQSSVLARLPLAPCTSKKCGLTNRSTGPIAACRRLG